MQKVIVCEACYIKILDSAKYDENLKNLAKYAVNCQTIPENYGPIKSNRIMYKTFVKSLFLVFVLKFLFVLKFFTRYFFLINKIKVILNI